jgi:hypothetical protein
MRAGNIKGLMAGVVVVIPLCLWASVLAGQSLPADAAPVAVPTGARTKSPATRPAPGSDAGKSDRPTTRPADAKQLGGEPESIVQVANLIYAGTKSSKCFSDHFLVAAEKESAISTSRRFHAVKLDSQELFAFPLVIMTGEGAFTLTGQERENLRSFIDRGGFLLASAGCSSKEWGTSLRRELTRIFPESPLQEIGMDHPVFHTVYEINSLQARHGMPRPLEGITIHGHLGLLYSQEGLNDTAHAQGCCCCGGNEITNAVQVNVNILAYALVY